MFGSAFNIKKTLQEGDLNAFRTRLVNIIAVICAGICIFYSVIYGIGGAISLSIYFLGITFIYVLILVLNKNNFSFAARVLVVIASIITITSSLINFGRGSEVQIYLGVVLFFIFLLFKSRTIKLLFIAIVYGAFIGSFYYLDHNEALRLDYRQPYDHYINYGYGLFGITILAYIIINAILSYLKQTNESIKRVKEKNKELESKNTLIEKQKNEMQLFTAIASHDLKSPVRIMRSFLGLVDKKIDKPENIDEVKKYLNFVYEGSNELNNIINGISTFRKIGDYDISDSYGDSKVILDRIINQIKGEFREDITIKANDIPRLKINGSHLEILFYAILKNGIAFNESENKIVQLNTAINAGQFIMEVTDNGIGIEKQYADYIFQPFKKLNTSDKYKSAGLGLNNVKKIVEMYGGIIRLDTSYDRGSKFDIMFPLELVLK